MQRLTVKTVDGCIVIMPDEKGKFVRVADLIEELDNIDVTCGDYAYADIQALIDKLL